MIDFSVKITQKNPKSRTVYLNNEQSDILGTNNMLFQCI